MGPPTTVLIFAYYSYLDPVFQSAVLPYFEGLSNSGDLRFILLTFEQDRYSMTEQQECEARSLLDKNNIAWYRLRWHSGRFKLFKKAYDFMFGVLRACYLVLRFKASSVYSEGFPGAILGYFVARMTGARHIIHTFEPHADSCLESGEWSEASWEARLLKSFEGNIAHHAYALLSGTEAYAALWKERGCSTPFYRVPSCVDVDFFKFSPEARAVNRNRLGVQDQDRLVVYLGKFGGMYWEQELGQLFQAFQEALGERVHFLVITIDPQEVVERSLSQGDFERRRLTVIKAAREDVPGLLSAGDVGICGVKQRPSKRFCSPIKDGEYWSCGLPILIPEGISDDYLLARSHEIGVSLKNLTLEGFREGVADTLRLWDNVSPDSIREKARSFALRDRAVQAYRPLLRQLFATSGNSANLQNQADTQTATEQNSRD